MNRNIVVERKRTVSNIVLLAIGIAIGIVMVILWNIYDMSNMLSTIPHKLK